MASSCACGRGEVALSLLDADARAGLVCPPEAPTADQRFPRSCRLTARRQYVAVYNKGRKARRRAFTVFGLRNELGRCRIGLTVTRRVGSAVVRNRVKRLLRDAFRRRRDDLPGDLDLVVNGQRSLLTMTMCAIEKDLVGAVAELDRKVRS